MGLVNDEGVVGPEQRVGLRFGQQNAVGHQLDRGIAAQPVLKTHLVAHHVAQRRFQLFRNSLGHAGGRNAARLGVANQPALTGRVIEFAAAHRERDLGQLRGFSRAGLTANDDDLVGAQRRRDVVAPG